VNEVLKKLLETWQDGIYEVEALKAYRFLVFLFCNIHIQTEYYKKGIRHLVANFLGCNVTTYY